MNETTFNSTTKRTPIDCTTAAVLLDLCHGTIIRPADWTAILRAHKDKWVDQVKAMDAANGRLTALHPDDEHALWAARFPWEDQALAVMEMMVSEGAETVRVVESRAGMYVLCEHVITPDEGRTTYFYIVPKMGGA